MATITIGSGTGTRNNYAGAGTARLDTTGPADGTGIITTWKVWLYAGPATSGKFGTATKSGTTVTVRDVDTVGAIAAGSEQTFTGLSTDVVTGDFACQINQPWAAYIYFGYTAPNNFLYNGADLTAGSSVWTDGGYQQKYAFGGTGTTVSGWTNIAKVFGVGQADIAKVMGVAIADIAKIDGVAV